MTPVIAFVPPGPEVTDATAGFLSDSMIFLSLGHKVTAVEQSKVIYCLVKDAIRRASPELEFLKNLNFKITIIDPREYFTTKQKFENVKIINKWPDEVFKNIQTNSNTALITLTHDPKIDDPALKHAIRKKFFYIGALGSKKTHENRCKRLKDFGFKDEEINSIHGPIGIKIGGKSAPEIALSIVAQLISERNKL